MEERLQKIEEELLAVKERNKRVEADKAWETSVLRVFLIATITYLTASVALLFIGIENYFLNALIPTIGYLLSTLSIPPIKKWWIRKRY
ncbi:MAG: hypothetical protein A3B23_02000 [Candidatus Colwellbacteria bacterium RIFCSPLOWO2_01_FULL_48_10]|uniref:Uncharacterized protein n=2 Tax=Bacteria candidate phyla TaxID=1783234 RepID=A0A1F5P1E9_9BACT|nr:MAG: hypothetical protein A2846_04370 [Candidatus Doudnabacteria bacterium RIFCSPHIGHO2_01_FULL_49_9]OGY59111.1 MAG: hypothetical protein A3B23_02000 [Candidatus Colwellbacteria bacterium RIFCSPLOWO2_01_FULL_48_10]